MKRTLRLRSLKDENIYELVDGGINERGEPTQSRMQAQNALRKRVASLDDPDVSLPLFQLAEDPKVFSIEDSFDRELLKDRDGSWVRPTAKWLEEQHKRLARRSDSAALAEQKVKAMLGTQIAGNLAELVSRQQAAQPAPVPVVPPKKAEAEKGAKL